MIHVAGIVGSLSSAVVIVTWVDECVPLARHGDFNHLF